MEYQEAAKKFLQYLQFVKNVSDHTIRNYLIDLNSFLQFICDKEKIKFIKFSTFKQTHKSIHLSTIDKWLIRKYLENLYIKKQKAKTLARKISSLRSFFKFSMKKKYIKKNPLDYIETPKKEKTLPKAVSYDEVSALFSKPDIKTYLGLRDRTIMELFYSSGIRLSELVFLDLQDIDLQERSIKVKGKGKKQRLIPITKTAASFIEKYLSHPDRDKSISRKFKQNKKAIFLNKYGGRISTRSVDRKFKEYLKQSDLLHNITPHVIRHSIATHWLENGMDLKTIQTLLGHSLLSTTTIYTKVTFSHKKKVYNDSHPRAK